MSSPKSTTTVRSALPHPPSWLPAFCSRSAFADVEVNEKDAPKSRRLELYDRLAADDFSEIPADVTDEELAWMDGFHALKLEAEKEERRMHFGAFALVGILLFILMPMLATATAPLVILLLAMLLIGLLVPYTLVYFGYENRVRAMAIGRWRIWEARAHRAEQSAAQSSATTPAATAAQDSTS